jgi:hypothetical protein
MLTRGNEADGGFAAGRSGKGIFRGAHKQGCIKFSRMKNMYIKKYSSDIHTGRFLWMDESTKKNYLDLLNKKISEGYFSSESVLATIVEDIAPVFNERIEA